jgi:hypothetical protein
VQKRRFSVQNVTAFPWQKIAFIHICYTYSYFALSKQSCDIVIIDLVFFTSKTLFKFFPGNHNKDTPKKLDIGSG